MPHLDDLEFVDLIDGRLAAARSAHVERCVECSARLAALRGAILDAVDAPVPEPSPLFWQHFSSRVSDAIAAADAAQRSDRRGRLHIWVARAAVAFAAVIVVAGAWRAWRPAGTSPAGETVARSVPLLPPIDTRDTWNEDIEADEAWAVVRTVADEIGWEETTAAGITAGPQSAERVVSQLSAEERSELARLLEEELRRTGA